MVIVVVVIMLLVVEANGESVDLGVILELLATHEDVAMLSEFTDACLRGVATGSIGIASEDLVVGRDLVDLELISQEVVVLLIISVEQSGESVDESAARVNCGVIWAGSCEGTSPVVGGSVLAPDDWVEVERVLVEGSLVVPAVLLGSDGIAVGVLGYGDLEAIKVAMV